MGARSCVGVEPAGPEIETTFSIRPEPEVRVQIELLLLCPFATIGGRRQARPMDRAFEEMSPAEQIQHVQDLWDRIAEHPEGVPVSDELKAELDRRLAAHRADPSSSIPWEQVKAELRRRQ
jgi:putative addiction module component (TIGR02574 family)